MNNVFNSTYESFKKAFESVDVCPGAPELILGLKNIHLKRGIKNSIKENLTSEFCEIVFIKHLKNALVIIYKDGTEKRCKNVWCLIQEILSNEEFVIMCEFVAEMSDDYPHGHYVRDYITREFKKGGRYARTF